ncbi:MAG TPA: hypothetical protein VFM63_09900 [Pyrinomonadaceae bacterium]|nr:hypothetical protein [Pyrinomonadaceae bacterium]
MKDDKLALYESLIRASLIFIFIVALSMGTFGLVVISQMLMRQAVANATFANTNAIASETGY